MQGNVRARMQPTKDEPQTLLELMVRMYAHEVRSGADLADLAGLLSATGVAP